MDDNTRRTGELPKPAPIQSQYGIEVRRPTTPPVTNYNNEVKNIVEIRKPTLDEMKSIFLVMLRDNEIIEEIRKRL